MFSPATSPPRLITLVLLAALSVLSLNMFLPSLAHMAEAFGVDYGLINLSVAGYLGVSAALQLIIGPLSDRFGRRPVVMAGLALFCVASVGCLLSTDIWVFLGFRMVQAAVVSGWVVSLAIIRDRSEEREAASLIGYVTMAMAIGPMLGPMFGGVLDELFGWESNFVVFVGLGVAMLGVCWIDLGETNTQKSGSFREQFRDYPALFGSRRFWGYALCMAFSVGAFYTFLAGAPLVAKAALSLSTAKLGFYMGSITAGFMFGSFLSGRYSTRFPLTTMMITGRIIACSGLSAGLILVLAGFVNEATVFGATVFIGIGNGLTMPSCNAGVLSVRPKLAGSAAGLAGALMVAGGAVFSTIVGAILTEANAVLGFLILLLTLSLLGLVSALAVRWIDWREASAAIRMASGKN